MDELLIVEQSLDPDCFYYNCKRNLNQASDVPSASVYQIRGVL